MLLNPPINNKESYSEVKEYEDRYEVLVLLPGYKKDEVEVTIEDGRLYIVANKENTTDLNLTYFTKTKSLFYKLQDNADLDSLEASLEDGVLKVVINKLKPSPTEKEDIIKIPIK